VGAGILVLAPLYLISLLLLKAAKSLGKLVEPLLKLLPSWLSSERIVSMLLVLCICFLVGAIVRTNFGRSLWERFETSILRKIPGYDLIRSLTQHVAGNTMDRAWTPALAEIEEALVPAFIIEELDDGQFTVFVPSVPTPLSGAIYILTPDRVHPLNVPFVAILKTVARWGAGSKDLVAAMERPRVPVG
jgi:uncharacterized membrane protein